jgi:heptosyltransferase III
VVQNPQPCLPCEKLGCEGHLGSFSRCLDELTSGQVLAAIDQALKCDLIAPVHGA